MNIDTQKLINQLRIGHRKSISKVITMIENNPQIIKEILTTIYKTPLHSSIIGITGPAGAGKSSLINLVAIKLKKQKKNPAILAIDPTSHLTGGAILGDRVRMSELTSLKIYIRSIASRGATGAISHSIHNIIRLLQYSKFDPIIIESVGAGQTEIEISHIADITIVVFNPNTGDNIQTIKAGLTEIGDIYIINKSDLNGASQLYHSIQQYADKSKKVFLISTKTGNGISEFVKTINIMMKNNKSNPSHDKNKLKYELKNIILNNINEKIDMMLNSNHTIKYLKMAYTKKITIFDAADNILSSILKNNDKKK